jgi:hypothetical protein
VRPIALRFGLRGLFHPAVLPPNYI